MISVPLTPPLSPPYSIRTILDECTLEPMVYRRWALECRRSDEWAGDHRFSPPIGRVTAMYTLHSEVALFPVSFRDHGLKHVSFKIAFPQEFLISSSCWSISDLPTRNR